MVGDARSGDFRPDATRSGMLRKRPAEEIGELEAQNTEESLEMAADLREKLKELDAKLERERIAYEVW